MSNAVADTETLEKLDARERGFLNYELTAWTVGLLGGAFGAAFLLMGGHVIFGLMAGAAGAYSFLKREEVKNEQSLITESSRGAKPATEWAKDLGKAPLMEKGNAPTVQRDSTPAPTDSNHPDSPEYPQNQRADGRTWEEVTKSPTTSQRLGVKN